MDKDPRPNRDEAIDALCALGRSEVALHPACSAVFAAVYAMRTAATLAEKVTALRSVFIREPMFISVTADRELDALEFYIAETILLPNAADEATAREARR